MSETVTEALNTLRAVAAEAKALKLQLSVALEEKASALVRVEGLEAERDRYREALEMLRRDLRQYDCRRTGGPVSDSGGKHCPPGEPCLTCRMEIVERLYAEVQRDRAETLANLVAANKRTQGAEAEVARLKLEANGPPMPGETSPSE